MLIIVAELASTDLSGDLAFGFYSRTSTLYEDEPCGKEVVTSKSISFYSLSS
jgi:hypothetical protein